MYQLQQLSKPRNSLLKQPSQITKQQPQQNHQISKTFVKNHVYLCTQVYYLGSNSKTSASLFPFLSFHCTFRLVFSDFLNISSRRGGNNELDSLSSSPLTCWSSTFGDSTVHGTSLLHPLTSVASVSIKKLTLSSNCEPKFFAKLAPMKIEQRTNLWSKIRWIFVIHQKLNSPFTKKEKPNSPNCLKIKISQTLYQKIQNLETVLALIIFFLFLSNAETGSTLMCSLCFQRRNRRTEKIINLKPLEPRRPSLRERERKKKRRILPRKWQKIKVSERILYKKWMR